MCYRTKLITTHSFLFCVPALGFSQWQVNANTITIDAAVATSVTADTTQLSSLLLYLKHKHHSHHCNHDTHYVFFPITTINVFYDCRNDLTILTILPSWLPQQFSFHRYHPCLRRHCHKKYHQYYHWLNSCK